MDSYYLWQPNFHQGQEKKWSLATTYITIEISLCFSLFYVDHIWKGECTAAWIHLIVHRHDLQLYKFEGRKKYSRERDFLGEIRNRVEEDDSSWWAQICNFLLMNKLKETNQMQLMCLKIWQDENTHFRLKQQVPKIVLHRIPAGWVSKRTSGDHSSAKACSPISGCTRSYPQDSWKSPE